MLAQMSPSSCAIPVVTSQPTGLQNSPFYEASYNHFRVRKTPAEDDYSRINRSTKECIKDAAKSTVTSIFGRCSVTEPTVSAFNYKIRPKVMTECSMQEVIDARIGELATHDFTAFHNNTVKNYIDEMNMSVFGTPDVFSAEKQRLFLSLIQACCQGSEGEDLYTQNCMDAAKEIIHSLKNDPAIIENRVNVNIKLNKPHVSTPDTILARFQVRLEESGAFAEDLPKELIDECHKMHEFYIKLSSMHVYTEAARMKELKQNDEGSASSSVKNGLTEFGNIAGKYAPIAYMSTLATALVERLGAAPSKLAGIKDILGNAGTTLSPDSLKAIKRLLEAEEVTNIFQKPANICASAFATLLYALGTLQNVMERSTNDSASEATLKVIEEIKDRIREIESSQVVTEQPTPGDGNDHFGSIASEHPSGIGDIFIERSGIISSAVRTINNAIFELKHATPDIPSRDYVYALLNRAFVTIMIYEFEGMKHQIREENYERVIQGCKTKVLTKQPLTETERDLLNYDQGIPNTKYGIKKGLSDCSTMSTMLANTLCCAVDCGISFAQAETLLDAASADNSNKPYLAFWKTVMCGPVRILDVYKALPICVSIKGIMETMFCSAGYSKYDIEHLYYGFMRSLLGLFPAVVWDIGTSFWDTVGNFSDTLLVTYSQDAGAARAKKKGKIFNALSSISNGLDMLAHIRSPKSVDSPQAANVLEKNGDKEDIDLEVHYEDTSPPSDNTLSSAGDFYSSLVDENKSLLMKQFADDHATDIVRERLAQTLTQKSYKESLVVFKKDDDFSGKKQVYVQIGTDVKDPEPGKMKRV